MPSSAPVPTPADLTGPLEARIARRGQPPPADEHTFTPQRTLQRLEAELARLLPERNSRGRHTQARMLYAFLTHEARTAPQLAALGGVGRVAGSWAHGGLVRAGLLHYQQQGRWRQYRLTRFGEDWLLAVARNETPPAAP
ncbi:hypothetical protein E5K00_14070 [Hymenobacter aquaticus]|uniref:ArsR family transcriptional regulator n=1 Tax=Hymenobacter aquaticus TaxID=1867101 RepID=A0A4Z0PWT7_9BACT|nr:hypothetical protein [Hymenobacter aquaticus]TGE21411.1 hypothetical protein E5K00_14070 [Hymenobacter aquaticus]